MLPTIPFGNDEQQLDQACTISFTTPTAAAILNDVARSLVRQHIDRLVILNAHGGNQFQPLVRDVQSQHGLLVVVANFYEMVPDVKRAVFEVPGDHADEMETSLLLHLCPDLVELEQAGRASAYRLPSKASTNRAFGRRGRGRKAIPIPAAAIRLGRRLKKVRSTLKRSRSAGRLAGESGQCRKGQLPYV